MKLKHIVLLTSLIITAALAYLFWTARQNAGQAPSAAEVVSLPLPSEDDAALRNQFHDELQQHLQKGEFTVLDSIANEATTKKLRFPGGDWKLFRFYEAVGSPPQSYSIQETVDWTARLELLEQWKKQIPDSIYASIALAEAHIGYSYELPGNSELEKAEKILNEISDKRTSCVAWFAAMQSLGLRNRWELQRMNNLVEEAAAVEPLYDIVYARHVQYLLVIGEPWEAFAEKSAARVNSDDRDILYAQICWWASRYYSIGHFFQKTKASYPRIRNGFIARLRKYGSSYRYLNAFCYVAVGARDRLTTYALMDKIGEHWEPDFWAKKEIFDEYKKWAKWH